MTFSLLYSGVEDEYRTIFHVSKLIFVNPFHKGIHENLDAISLSKQNCWFMKDEKHSIYNKIRNHYNQLYTGTCKLGSV